MTGRRPAPVIEQVMKLPFSTGQCDFGPEVQFRPGECVVRYDYTGEDLKISWVTVRFRAAIGTRFTPDPFVAADVLEAYSRVCIHRSSPWLTTLRAHPNHHQLRSELRHYLMYFDHKGGLEVIAESVHLAT